jgi:Trk K+ transport system NAD-binding subunit
MNPSKEVLDMLYEQKKPERLALVAGDGPLGMMVARNLTGSGFKVVVVEGDPTDSDVLEAHGIRHVAVVVAATRDDHVNYMVARFAKTIYGVPDVVSCISSHSQLDSLVPPGIRFVRPAQCAADSVLAAVLYPVAAPDILHARVI